MQPPLYALYTLFVERRKWAAACGFNVYMGKKLIETSFFFLFRSCTCTPWKYRINEYTLDKKFHEREERVNYAVREGNYRRNSRCVMDIY